MGWTSTKNGVTLTLMTRLENLFGAEVRGVRRKREWDPKYEGNLTTYIHNELEREVVLRMVGRTTEGNAINKGTRM